MATPYSFPFPPERSPLHERAIVVGLVVLLHMAVLAAYWMRPESPAVLVNEMSVSFANMQMQQADVVPRPKSGAREPEPLPAPQPAAKAAVQPVQQNAVQPSQVLQDASPPSPVLLDAEPDYHAAYLNNPRPPYPPMAKRMGWQGKLLLDVEVFADGKVGEVKLLQSCNHEILDNVAIQTVRTWRFVPARRLGQAVTQWVHVPFRFNLED